MAKPLSMNLNEKSSKSKKIYAPEDIENVRIPYNWAFGLFAIKAALVPVGALILKWWVLSRPDYKWATNPWKFAIIFAGIAACLGYSWPKVYKFGQLYQSKAEAVAYATLLEILVVIQPIWWASCIFIAPILLICGYVAGQKGAAKLGRKKKVITKGGQSKPSKNSSKRAKISKPEITPELATEQLA